MLEKTLENPLDCKEIQPVHPKGNQSWIFTERTDAKAATPILWPPDAKSWLIWKDPHAGKDWRQEEKGTTEDEMVGWHHWLNGHEFEQTRGDGKGQGSMVCCSPWGHKGSKSCHKGHDKNLLQQLLDLIKTSSLLSSIFWLFFTSLLLITCLPSLCGIFWFSSLCPLFLCCLMKSHFPAQLAFYSIPSPKQLKIAGENSQTCDDYTFLKSTATS